jgi:SAM-dependent methyltransferase
MPSSWDDAYTSSASPPRDIDRPQPAFAALADRGLLTGRVLDAGCGTGEHTLLAAAHGADAVGVDILCFRHGGPPSGGSDAGAPG